MQILEFVYAFTNKTVETIKWYESEAKSLTGPQKKARLDDTLKQWVDVHFNDLVKINFIFKGQVKKFVIKNISKLTQAIYDLIRIKVPGVGDNKDKDI